MKPYDLAFFTELIEKEIADILPQGHPDALYEPIRYVLNSGGKRIRPLLTLLGCHLFSDEPERAVRQALATEIFHNFTLIHDDIMDKAPLRRGRETVYKKFGSATAILSGDVMLVKAYELLGGTDPLLLASVLHAFNRCAAEVCEGQQEDMLFEQRTDVTEREYLDMIRKKTAVLPGFCLELGALLGGADGESIKHLREFGIGIGIAFQLRDDLLDVYGDGNRTGKQVGGDILAGKKTYLTLKALELSPADERARLHQILSYDDETSEKKISIFTRLYDSLDIREKTEQLIERFHEQAYAALEKVKAPTERKAMLTAVIEALEKREH